MLAARLGMLRREIMKWTDKRVGRMNELINGIQVRCRGGRDQKGWCVHNTWNVTSNVKYVLCWGWV